MEELLGPSNVSTKVRKGSRMGKSDLQSQNKKTIYNVYNFLKDLAEHPEKIASINFKKTQFLTAQMCGVGVRTVQKVCAEAYKCPEIQPVFYSPRTEIKRKRKIADIDEFDKDVVHCTINEQYDRERKKKTQELADPESLSSLDEEDKTEVEDEDEPLHHPCDEIEFFDLKPDIKEEPEESEFSAPEEDKEETEYDVKHFTNSCVKTEFLDLKPDIKQELEESDFSAPEEAKEETEYDVKHFINPCVKTEFLVSDVESTE